MGAASCATPPPETSDKATQYEVIEKVEYRPGRTVVQPYPVPDSELVADPPELSLEHITEDDIDPPAAMATAVAWAGSYHKVKDQYNTLRGWVAGVAAGTAMIQASIDAANPDAPGAKKDNIQETDAITPPTKSPEDAP